MKILITNDDGVFSSGILATRNALKPLGETIVVAPNAQQSGIGRAISLSKPIRIDEVKLRDESMAYSVHGTPTDAVTLAMFEIMDETPDLVVSGINLGENIGGGEITTSGTVSAAMEAASFNIPAIAISMEVAKSSIKFHDGYFDLDYFLAEKILYKIAKKVIKNGLPDGVDLLNINIPSGVENEEIEITKLGGRVFNPIIERRLDPRGKPYFWVDGIAKTDHEESTDGYTLKNNKKISITPLKLNLTGNLNSLKQWMDE
ncbi:MAG: 5'/3'-nucleotidase SurE [Methanobrevibacter sp.]|jgi:5'-nucleotidase|nr:5'/3'-nucleotidase SurE [Candidatus Methanoflexus mossambicus]